MRKNLLVIGILFFYMFSYSQDTVYLNNKWKQTEKDSARYYRVIQKDALPDKYYIRDFWITGEIYMEGQYSSPDAKEKDGSFISWYKNGKKHDESEYKKGKLIRINKAWDSAGNEIDGMIEFFLVEEKPEYQGGEEALLKYLAETVEYPKIAIDSGIQGKVFVSFIINTEGKVTDVKVARGVHPSLDAESLRVVESMNAWKPGKQEGKPVKVAYVVPINFKLEDNK